jgi:serine/threonine-protein kinase
MRITLTVTDGPHQGQAFVFDGHDTFLVGRSKRAHFRLPSKDRYFSRIHFLVEVNPPHCRLMDMSSSNGTFVNGRRVERTDLHDGDQIRAGQTILQVAVTETPGGRSGGHPALQPPDASAAAPSASEAPIPPPVPLPPSVRPLTPPSTTIECAGCAAPLSPPVGDIPLCPACQDQQRTLRQPIAGYHLIRELGRGAMGLVYLAMSQDFRRPVALKTIIPAAGSNEAQLQRFLREAGILRELDHPNIVAYRDIGESGGVLYFAMDFVRGKDAHQLVRRDGPFEVGRAAALGCQLLDALDFAHKRGFVHRDIKPSNLMITGEVGAERLMVADFGLAKVYQQSNLSGLTMTGDVGGTIPFMAPEQITEYRSAKPPVDQYSAAASLYNLLTASYVYDFPPSFQNQLLTVLNDEVVPIRKRRPDLPEELAAIIMRGLAREPADRFPDAAAMRDALRKFVS